MVESLVSSMSAECDLDDLDNTYGVNVGNLISKFADEDELNRALQEAEESKAMAQQALEREAELRLQVDAKSGKW